MFSNSFQSGFTSIFYSIGSNPLNLWDKAVKNGHIRRVIDDEVKSLVLEISGTNVATTYITCPIKPRASLGIRLPFLVMVVKNMKRYFTFEIQIIDDKDMRRRFRVSNFQSTTKVRPFCTTMPIGLSSGWNQIQFNLADFTRRAYGTVYTETIRVQIHANVRIRRIYFSDRLYSEEDLPSEYKLFLPISGKKDKVPEKEKGKGDKAAPAEKQMETQIKAETGEREIPSGAPPTPAEDREPEIVPEIVETAQSTEAAAGDVPDLAELTEKPDEKPEELTTAEVPSDAAAPEGAIEGETVAEEVAPLAETPAEDTAPPPEEQIAEETVQTPAEGEEAPPPSDA